MRRAFPAEHLSGRSSTAQIDEAPATRLGSPVGSGGPAGWSSAEWLLRSLDRRPELTGLPRGRARSDWTTNTRGRPPAPPGGASQNSLDYRAGVAVGCCHGEPRIRRDAAPDRPGPADAGMGRDAWRARVSRRGLPRAATGRRSRSSATAWPRSSWRPRRCRRARTSRSRRCGTWRSGSSRSPDRGADGQSGGSRTRLEDAGFRSPPTRARPREPRAGGSRRSPTPARCSPTSTPW